MSVNAKMTAIADAIRAKTGGTSALTLDQMAAEIAGIQGGGYTIEEIAIDAISGEIVLNSGMLRPYAFAFCSGITKAVLNKGLKASSTSICAAFESSSIVEATGDLESNYIYPHEGGFANLFRGCKSLKKVVMPNFIPYSSACFSCTALEYVDIYRVNGSQVFSGCTNLKVIILRGAEVRALGNNNTAWDFALNNTPFDPDNTSATGGFCLVPAALVAEYQAATNWSVLYEAGTCTFLPLEEYTADGTTTGEIDWDKLNAVVYPE